MTDADAPRKPGWFRRPLVLAALGFLLFVGATVAVVWWPESEPKAIWCMVADLKEPNTASIVRVSDRPEGPPPAWSYQLFWPCNYDRAPGGVLYGGPHGLAWTARQLFHGLSPSRTDDIYRYSGKCVVLPSGNWFEYLPED